MTCEEAGQSGEQYANDLWAEYPEARLIIGGILAGDYDGRSVARGIEFGECMVASMAPSIYAKASAWHLQRDPVWPCPAVLDLWDANGMTKWGGIYMQGGAK